VYVSNASDKAWRGSTQIYTCASSLSLTSAPSVLQAKSKNKMTRLPEGGIVDGLLEINKYDFVNVQPGFFFRFADDGPLQPFAQFHAAARAGRASFSRNVR
jgi:hypothetical protein